MPTSSPPPFLDSAEIRPTLEKFRALKHRHLGRLLHLSFRQFTSLGQHMLAEHGYGDFKTGCFGLLSNLDAEGNTVVELAERLFYTKQAVSKMVKDLEEAGYMHSIPHPVDKRAQLVRLTARGVELVSMATDQMNDFKQNFTKSLTHEEEEQLINLLGKLVEANMGALHPAHMLAVQTK